MARVLFVGQQPETVDFIDPTLPPGGWCDGGDALKMRRDAPAALGDNALRLEKPGRDDGE